MTSEDTSCIQAISLISGLDENKVQQVFESFLILFTLEFSTKKSIHIPFIGNFLIKYLRDDITDEGKEAVINSFFSPSDQIKRIIGQLIDIDKTKNYSELDTYKMLKKVINQDFKLNLEKETLN